MRPNPRTDPTAAPTIVRTSVPPECEEPVAGLPFSPKFGAGMMVTPGDGEAAEVFLIVVLVG